MQKPELEGILISGAEKFSLRLNEPELNRFRRYFELILEFNKKLNLTAISDEKEIVVKHFIDSLSGCRFLKENSFVMDMGSGMGCPGIPVKIARPDIKLIFLESNQKKSAFINLVLRDLKIKDARSIAQRAEDKNFQETMSGQFDAILTRAFGRLDLILKLSKPYLKSGGRLIAYKSVKADEELREAEKAIASKGFRLIEIYEYELMLEMGSRKLLVLKKA